MANFVGHNHVWRMLDDKVGPKILINNPVCALDGPVLMSGVDKRYATSNQQRTLSPVLSGAHF